MAESSKWSPSLRDFKIDMVSGERTVSVSEMAKARFAEELRFISANIPGAVITGSLALNLYGLIERSIGDIDIIIADGGRYSGYSKGCSYGAAEDGEMKLANRLGYIVFREKRGIFDRLFRRDSRCWQVDFFESKEAKFQEFEFEGKPYRIHDPISILETKCVLESVSRNHDGPDGEKAKHFRDLACIF